MASKIKVDTLETADGTGSITLNNPLAGNVGIGVTPESDWRSDITALQVGSGGSIFARSDSGETKMFISENVKWTSAGNEYINNGYASLHQLDGGTQAFKVAPSGTAGNAISWTTALQIDNGGSVTAGDVSTGGVGFQWRSDGIAIHSKSGTGYNSHARFNNANGIVGSITTSGSATAYNTSSDYRLKENVIPMSGSIDRLKELKPSRFNFIADADKTVDGFLAHEAQAIVPEAVTGEKDAMKMEDYEVTPAVMDGDGNVITEAVMGEREVPDIQGIDQAKLVPLLTSALQDAIAKIEQLESRISALEVN
jgi:hypothetical protein